MNNFVPVSICAPNTGLRGVNRKTKQGMKSGGSMAEIQEELEGVVCEMNTNRYIVYVYEIIEE